MPKKKRIDPDPDLQADLRRLGFDKNDIQMFENGAGIITVTDPVSGRTVKIKPDNTPESETGVKNKYKFYFAKRDGYWEFFDVRELPNWTEQDRARDASKRIVEAVDKRLLDVSV